MAKINPTTVTPWRFSLVNEAHEREDAERRLVLEQLMVDYYHLFKARASQVLPPTSFVLGLEPDYPAFRRIDVDEVRDIFTGFKTAAERRVYALGHFSVELSLDFIPLLITDLNSGEAFKTLSEETRDFIDNKGLYESVKWLQMAAPAFFPNTHFEIELLPSEDDDKLLALKVFGAFSTIDFRKRMHLICQAMLQAGHEDLYGIISIFQRRVSKSGWEALSFYSRVFAE